MRLFYRLQNHEQGSPIHGEADHASADRLHHRGSGGCEASDVTNQNKFSTFGKGRGVSCRHVGHKHQVIEGAAEISAILTTANCLKLKYQIEGLWNGIPR